MSHVMHREIEHKRQHGDPTMSRRMMSPAEKDLRTLIRTMNKNTGKSYGIATQITGEYAGYVRYRHCLTETVGETIHKRSPWKSTHAALLDHLQRKVQRSL